MHTVGDRGKPLVSLRIVAVVLVRRWGPTDLDEDGARQAEVHASKQAALATPLAKRASEGGGRGEAACETTTTAAARERVRASKRGGKKLAQPHRRRCAFFRECETRERERKDENKRNRRRAARTL